VTLSNSIYSKTNLNKLREIKYQPEYPLVYDDKDGPYRMITSLEMSIQKDFENLLLTSEGEWPMNPEIGVGLRDLLFENHSSDLVTGLESRIRNQVQLFLPSVEIMKVDLTTSPEDKDNNILKIKLIYSILGGTVLSSTVNIGANKNISIKIESTDRYSSSFRDRSTELQSHLTEI
tara:strand:- start:32 stop:559 length:528 start_codon:yes stop_codon:yes gene_type:complete